MMHRKMCICVCINMYVYMHVCNTIYMISLILKHIHLYMYIHNIYIYICIYQMYTYVYIRSHQEGNCRNCYDERDCQPFKIPMLHPTTGAERWGPHPKDRNVPEAQMPAGRARHLAPGTQAFAEDPKQQGAQVINGSADVLAFPGQHEEVSGGGVHATM